MGQLVAVLRRVDGSVVVVVQNEDGRVREVVVARSGLLTITGNLYGEKLESLAS